MSSATGFLSKHLVAKCKSCLDHKKSGASISGKYIIYPKGNTPVETHCDMETNGGGWTLLTPEIAKIVGVDVTWENPGANRRTIQGRGSKRDCGDFVNYSLKVYDIVPKWSEIRMDLHKQSRGVQQCSRFRDIDDHIEVPGQAHYKIETDGTETPYGLCQWGDGLWAYSSNTSYGRHKEWRMYSPRMSRDRNHMYYTMVCAPTWESYYFYQADMWVR